jgi:hypothetical protein
LLAPDSSMVIVVTSAIFVDDFESGSLSAWTVIDP